MSSSDKWESSQDLSVAAFLAVRDLLPEEDASEISGYIYEANEWGLGVEVIFHTLVECNIEVSQRQKRVLDAAADSMGMDHEPARLLVADS